MGLIAIIYVWGFLSTGAAIAAHQDAKTVRDWVKTIVSSIFWPLLLPALAVMKLLD